jgi:hypothetical protein
MITVVTSITSGKDSFLQDQVRGNAKFIAFLDNPKDSDVWEIKKAHDRFTDPRRNSRIHKMLIHKYVDTEYSIWIDGNIRLLKTPEELIEKYLKDCDLAVFKHPNRDCLYDEAMVCAKLRLDDPEVIIEQAKAYEDSGYAKHKGLCECGIIIRRHTQKVEEFNDAWWAEYCRYSRRDQISFMYAVDKVGLQIHAIGDYFKLKNHLDPMSGGVKGSGDFEIITHQHKK